MKYDIVKLMARRKIRWKKRWVSGDSGGRLTFRSKKAGRLSDYRIYGNTVNGENVGDLITEGEHAGEYSVPVTVEGKNLAKNNYAKSSTLFTVEEVNNFIHVSGTNNSGSTKAYVISAGNLFPVGTYDIVNNSNTAIVYDYRDENDVLVSTNVNANSIKTFNFPAVFTRKLNVFKSVSNGNSIDNYFQVMIVKHGDGTDTYEPYHAPVTTPIYLPEQIRKVGDEAEYIDYGEQKMHRIGADDIDVTLPAIPTLTGTNVLSVGTAVQPSRVEVKGRIKAVGQETEPEPEAAEAEQE